MTSQVAALLLELAVKSSLLLALAFAIAAFARRLSSEERHVVWVFALVGLLVLPIASIVGPTVGLPVDELADRAKIAWSSARVEPSTPNTPTGNPAHSFRIGDTSKDTAEPRSTFNDRQTRPPAAPGVLQHAEAASLVSTMYGAVALLLLAWFLLAAFRITLSLRRYAPVTDASVLALLKEIKLRRGIRRDIRLRASRSDITPWVWGVVRPVIVLPADFARWPSASRRHALEHEISHVGRLDFLTAMLGCVCCALYWFQPLAWLAFRRMTRESERACDDRVLLAGGSSASYAAQLLDMAKSIHSKNSRPMLTTAMAEPSSVSERISSILDPGLRRRTMSKKKTLCTLILTLTLAVPLAALKSQAAATGEGSDLTDSEFQALVEKGPADSDELARIVRTFAAQDRTADALDVLVDYVSHDATIADPDCRFCGSILKSEDMGNEHSELLPTLLSAFDEVESRARAANDGDLLLRLAAISGASGSDQAMQRGTYYLLEGFRIGDLSDQSKLAAIHFLNDLGWYEQAKKLAEQLHNDESSSLYQSSATEDWIRMLDSRMTLSNSIYERLVTPGFTTEVDPEGNMMPLYRRPPVYPPAALGQGLEGEVVLKFTITESGKPDDITVVRSSNAAFGDTAADALSDWLYAPRLVNGVAAEMTGVQLVMRFKLEP